MRSGLPEPEAGGAETDPGRIRELREELNWYYHRIEFEQLSGDARSRHASARSRPRRVIARRRCSHTRDMPVSQATGAGMRAAPALTVETIRAAMGPDTVLVEYFMRAINSSPPSCRTEFWKCFRCVPGRA